jgi:crotonobetainyl-CoA:carnitine CoA-transferase CaiB-like acyl-CoA transferase
MPGPLDGVRVLDFTVFQQGPQATLVMADMGADVIKAEALVYGDFGRLLQVHNGVGAYHLAHNRGKRRTSRRRRASISRARSQPASTCSCTTSVPA